MVAGLTVAAGMVIAFAVTGFLIDAAVQWNQITGQTIIFHISQEARSRVDSIYLTSMFAIGALDSVVGSFCYDVASWGVTAGVGAAIGGASLLVFLLRQRGNAAREILNYKKEKRSAARAARSIARARQRSAKSIDASDVQAPSTGTRFHLAGAR